MMAREVVEEYCGFAGCERVAKRGEWCDGHEQQMRRYGRMTELVEVPTDPRDRLREAALAYADATDDEAHRRADDNLRKSASAFARRSFFDAVTEGRARARAEGVRFGRPPTVTLEQAKTAMAEHGTMRRAARALGVSLWAVWRVLHREE